MSDKHRDGRLEDAHALMDRVAALKSVKRPHRVTMVHDELVSAIDDICAKRKDEIGVGFTKNQVIVIKDIIFHVLYILDQENHPPGNVFSSKWKEFRDLNIGAQIGVIGGILAIAVTCITGAWTLGSKAYNKFIDQPAMGLPLTPTKVAPTQSVPMQQPAANTPSTGEIQAH